MKCTKCEKEILLQSSDDEPYRIDGEPACSDCYFWELGVVISKHPPGINSLYHKGEHICPKCGGTGTIRE